MVITHLCSAKYGKTEEKDESWNTSSLEKRGYCEECGEWSLIIAAAYSLHSFSQSLTRTEGVMLRRNCLFPHRRVWNSHSRAHTQGGGLKYSPRQRERLSCLCWSEFACCFRRVSHAPLHRVSALFVIMSHTPLFSESSPTPFGPSPPKPLFPAIPAPSAADPLQNGARRFPQPFPWFQSRGPVHTET